MRRWGARRACTAEIAQAAPRRTPPRPFSSRGSRSRNALALSLAVAAAASTLGCVHLDLPLLEPAALTEVIVDGTGGPKVLLLDLDGVFGESPESGPFGFGERESTVARVRAQLDLARKDADVRAVVLRIQSPGGTVTASDILYHEILRFKQDKGVPVVAQLMGVAASGAYYAAMAADAVYAHPTTITGSIGVIFSGLSFAGLLEKLGVEDQTVKSGERKDTGSPLRRMTPAERAQLQSVIDDLHGRFREVVATGRAKAGLTAERVRELADGRIFVASQAKEAGLVDGIAYLPDTIEEAKRRAGLGEARVILYQRETAASQASVYSRSPVSSPSADAASILAARALPSTVRVELGLGPESPVRGPAFLYLWWSGE